MMIRRGWSEEYGKRKFDVEIDETDLERLLAEHGSADPVGHARQMTVQQVYTVMDATAMIIVHDTLRRRPGADVPKQVAAIEQFRAVRESVLDEVMGIEREPAPV